MSDAELQRVQADLETLRQAAGVELPFQRQDIWWPNLVYGLAGLVIAAIGWWVPVEYRWVALLPAAVVLGVWAYLARSAHRQRATTPARWREYRYGLWWLVLFAPIFIGYLLWQAWLGMSMMAVTATAVFFLGLGMAWIALVDRTRRHYFGSAISFLIFASVMPWCSPRAMRAGAGFMVVAIALGTAAIQAWLLRRQRSRVNGD